VGIREIINILFFFCRTRLGLEYLEKMVSRGGGDWRNN